MPPAPLTTWEILRCLSTYIVGFFATAGAAGTDIASNSRNGSDVQWGGLIGVTVATIIAGGMAILVVAGAYGADMVPGHASGSLNGVELIVPFPASAIGTKSQFRECPIVMILLAISSFPGGCFSALIAANSFKTTLPKVNPFSPSASARWWPSAWPSGLGRQRDRGLPGHRRLVRTGLRRHAGRLLVGRPKVGRAAGRFQPGRLDLLDRRLRRRRLQHGRRLVPALADKQSLIPVPPVAAFIVGFVLYFIVARIGLTSPKLDMPATAA